MAKKSRFFYVLVFLLICTLVLFFNLNLFLFLKLYLAWFLSIFIHELGHLNWPGIKFPTFPLPVGAITQNSRSKYGGLLINLICLAGVWFLGVQGLTFLSLFGLMNWALFCFYTILGAIGLRGILMRDKGKDADIGFGNIPALIIGIAVLYFFGRFYLPVLTSVIGYLI